MTLVEDYADRLFKELGLDVEFSRHFRDRLNDPRNAKPISAAELYRDWETDRKSDG